MPQLRYDIFISYAGPDEEWARRLYERLCDEGDTGQGLRVFFAPESLRPGALISRELRESMRASRQVALILTPNFFARDWTEFEASLETYRDPAARDTRIIPLIVRDCEIPEDLARLRPIDFRDDGAFERSLAELLSTVNSTLESDASEQTRFLQRERVLNAAVLPWSPQGSPSFRFLWPERFIDPSIRTHRAPGRPVRFSEWDASHKSIRAAVVLGAPGGGKTTLLRTLFLDEDERIPHARNASLVTASELVAQGVDSMTNIPRRVGDSDLILIDGVDEVGAASLGAVMDYVRVARAAGATVRLGCRTDFFFRHVAMHDDWSPLFDELVELQEWSRTDAERFVERYADQAGDETLYDKAIGLLERIPTKNPLWSNPLQLTLLLYLVHSGVHITEEELTYPYALYGVVYHHWQHREQHRGTGRAPSSIVEAAHLALAKALDATRGHDPPRIRDTIAAVSGDNLDAVMEDTAFRGLIDSRISKDRMDVAVGFRHETFAEFVISRSVVSAFEQGGSAIDTALTSTFGSHINRFVRSGLDYKGSIDRSGILDNLVERYRALIDISSDVDVRAESIREQLVYYIGRWPARECLPLLQEVYRVESTPIVRRSAALGAILHGDEAIESDYLTRLREDEGEATLNRSVQIVYFLDDVGDLHTYVDRGFVSWQRTRDHIFERLVLHDLREMRLRWWDMETLLNFFRSRPHDRLSAAEFDVLSRTHCGPEGAERTQVIRHARDLILKEAGA